MARSFIAVFQISHMPYGIRNSEFGIPESGIGNSEKRQIMVRSDAFRWNPRKHWSECGSQISSWCGIFPLDHEGDGAVGCAHRRMERWCNNEQIMSNEIIRIAARATKTSRIFAVRSGGHCRSYHVGGRVWNEAVAKATAMVEGREVVTRKGHAGYVEGFRPDGSEFNRGGVGPL